jgi:hypothetical protein
LKIRAGVKDIRDSVAVAPDFPERVGAVIEGSQTGANSFVRGIADAVLMFVIDLGTVEQAA